MLYSVSVKAAGSRYVIGLMRSFRVRIVRVLDMLILFLILTISASQVIHSFDLMMCTLALELIVSSIVLDLGKSRNKS